MRLPPALAHLVTAASLGAIALLAGSGTGHSADPGTPAPARAAWAARLAEFRRPAPVEHPADNAPTAERRALGKLLFFDPRLSRRGTMSCATCHDPAYSWTEPRATAASEGGAVGHRRTQTILNTGWAAALFWDGRAESLEQQALGPVASPMEMNLPVDALVARLNAVREYRALFARAYGTDSVTATTIARALAQFERSVVSTPAPFDRWAAGDETAVSAEAKQGFLLFTGRAGCANCHAGWRFTDDSFHDVGVAGGAQPDSGRAAVLPGIEALQFAFKTPTLRNVAVRAPYMHDGSERTLAEVVELYDRGGRVRRPGVAAEVRPLGLTPAEQRALVAFMGTLTSADTVRAPHALPAR